MNQSSYGDRYQFCMRCGHPKPKARAAWVYQCEACEFKHFINPIAAVVAILLDRQGNLLMIRRARDPGRGKLGFPGGFVDPRETAEEALRREVREETMLELEDFSLFVTLPNDYLYQGLSTPTLDLFYAGTMSSFARAEAMSEVESLVIVPPKEVDFDAIAFSSNAKALRLFLDQARPSSSIAASKQALKNRQEQGKD